MQTLAESLGPLDARARRATPSCEEWIGRFADLYEHYGPVIRAWTEAEIGSDEFGRLGTDVLARFTRVLDRAHRRGRARPTSTRSIAALALVAMLERLNYYVLVAPGARRTGRRWSTRSPRHARRAVRHVAGHSGVGGSGFAGEDARLEVAELVDRARSTRPRPSRARSRRRRSRARGARAARR